MGDTREAAANTEAAVPERADEQQAAADEADADGAGSNAEEEVELAPVPERVADDDDDGENTFERRGRGAFAARGFVPKDYDMPPEKPPPTLEEYQRDWDERLARHSRAVPGEFSRDNLVPKPIHDCSM
jgi:hypothetical protein